MPDLFDILFRYFGFLASAVILLNLWITRDRVTSKVKVYLTSYSMLFFLWGALQIMGGYKSFFFVILPPKEHPLAALFWLIYFVWLWGSTVWVIWNGGAEEMAQSGIVHSAKGPATPQSIKFFFAASSLLFPALILLGFSSGLFNKLVTDLPIF
jgi:hypothetical protein